MDTLKTAKKMVEIAGTRQQEKLFSAKKILGAEYGKWVKETNRARSKEIQYLFQNGFGMHHAGMVRADRTLTEKLFLNGAIRVLCCTATLAWGVNLPARAVIIKGTQLYNAEKGGFMDMGILDVMQVFGRAGRPGFDTQGSATLITEHAPMLKYLSQVTNQFPIDSQLIGDLENTLNAEVAMGNIVSQKDALDWLGYTFLFVRMIKSPQTFGVVGAKKTPSLNRGFSPITTCKWCFKVLGGNVDKRLKEMVNTASKTLDTERLIRAPEATGTFNTTDLGRVACKYYLDHETAKEFNDKIQTNTPDSEILAAFGEAKEFKQLKIREEETSEMNEMKNDRFVCAVKTKLGSDSVAGKVSILLQAYLARKRIETFSLVSDSNYITQQAGRLFRAMFEICMTRVSGMSNMAESLLEWAKMVDNRIQWWHHTLRHFCYPPGERGKPSGGYSKDKKGGVLSEATCERLETLKQYE